ncbi:MAG: 6-carboxytetrahydropterin synthase [Planctomycetaceae bacterium]
MMKAEKIDATHGSATKGEHHSAASHSAHEFRVRVTKDHLVFSAAHFVTIADFCERLHGHNWRVGAVVAGGLDENTFVVDFIALRDTLQQIVNQLDHHMLLPTRHKEIAVQELPEQSVEVRHGSKRWVFPLEDCILLPVDQTTAERLAEWIGERLQVALLAGGATKLTSIEVEVEENFGQSAYCLRHIPPQ